MAYFLTLTLPVLEENPFRPLLEAILSGDSRAFLHAVAQALRRRRIPCALEGGVSHRGKDGEARPHAHLIVHGSSEAVHALAEWAEARGLGVHLEPLKSLPAARRYLRGQVGRLFSRVVRIGEVIPGVLSPPEDTAPESDSLTESKRARSPSENPHQDGQNPESMEPTPAPPPSVHAYTESKNPQEVPPRGEPPASESGGPIYPSLTPNKAPTTTPTTPIKASLLPHPWTGLPTVGDRLPSAGRLVIPFPKGLIPVLLTHALRKDGIPLRLEWSPSGEAFLYASPDGVRGELIAYWPPRAA